jgi:hypothetical protein
VLPRGGIVLSLTASYGVHYVNVKRVQTVNVVKYLRNIG